MSQQQPNYPQGQYQPNTYQGAPQQQQPPQQQQYQNGPPPPMQPGAQQQYGAAPYNNAPQQGGVALQPAIIITGRWDQGLCGCFGDCDSCCYGMCCGPCALASAKSKTDGSDCCFNCLLSTFCYCFVSPCWRGNIRDANGIDGGFVSDCLTMFCCASCAVCQMHHQAKQTVLLAPPGPPGMMHN